MRLPFRIRLHEPLEAGGDGRDLEWASRVRDADGVVGLDFFAGVARQLGVSWLPSRGILARLDELAHEGFDPSLVDPWVREVYERTGSLSFHGLRIDYTWHGWLRQVAYRSATGWSRQLDVPVRTGFFPRRMSSTVQIAHDTRQQPLFRGWLRRFERSERVFYGGLVSPIRRQGTPYLLVALPIWGGNVSVRFLPTNWRDGGVRLRSHAPGDAESGMFVVLPSRSRARRPTYTEFPAFGLSDELRVWPDTDPTGHRVLRARHIGRWFDRLSFELHYVLRPYTPDPRSET